MSAWEVVLLCWACYVLGFFTAALMSAAREPREDEYRARLTDD